ncbi:MAG: hypothetical protein ACRDAP_07525 [Shewanella sp.]
MAIKKYIFAVRDTAVDADITDFVALHVGEAYAKLASIVIASQRISFELYQIGVMGYSSDTNQIDVINITRSYVCSATQAMLDSHFEDAEALLDPKEDTADDNVSA